MRLTAVLILLASLVGACTPVVNDDTNFASKSSELQAAQVNTQLGVQYLQQGDLIRSKDKLEKAMRQNKDSVLAFTYAGLLYEQLDELEDAEKAYRHAIRNRPKDPVSNNLYATYLCRQGQYELADKHFLTAANNPLYRTREAAFTNAGVCALKADNLPAAETHFLAALSLNPTYSEALLQLANLKLIAEEELQARAYLERFFESGGMEPAALLLGYKTENRLGDYPKANTYAEQLRTIYPDSGETLELIRN